MSLSDITATVIQDSISPEGNRLVTFQLHYPRYVHAELLTHRMLSRNSASSRAIPIKDMIAYVLTRMAFPVHWGKNQPGMQAKEQVADISYARFLWESAGKVAASFSKLMMLAGLHKQVANRPTEPYQFMNVVMSATEIMNLFHLRYHPDADPTLEALIAEVYRAYISSVPMLIHADEWHVPYVLRVRGEDGVLRYYDEADNEISVEEARMISASCCAQVSYRKNDPSLEKAENIFNRLVLSEPLHASPMEHQATPLDAKEYGRREQAAEMIEDEIALFVGNYRGWRQFRKLFKNENFTGTFVPKEQQNETAA